MEGDEALFAGRAQVLDVAAVASVKAAVRGLNDGELECDADRCVVWSASSQGYYLLYHLRPSAGTKEMVDEMKELHKGSG